MTLGNVKLGPPWLTSEIFLNNVLAISIWVLLDSWPLLDSYLGKCLYLVSQDKTILYRRMELTQNRNLLLENARTRFERAKYRDPEIDERSHCPQA